MFVRFVVGADADHHRLLTGLINEVAELRDDGELEPYEEQLVDEILEWFGDHLPVPPFSSDWSEEARCWFKNSATEPILRMRDLVVILEANGKLVRMLRTSRPGKVLYEDEFQVVVEEWKELAR